MNTEQLKNWIKRAKPEFAGIIRLGGVEGNAERFLGVYPAQRQGKAFIAIGGPSCTSYDTMAAKLLLRWGKSLPAAEAKAKELWGLFYGLNNVDMDGAAVCYAEPGAAPIPVGKGADGIFEYVINLSITYKKE